MLFKMKPRPTFQGISTYKRKYCLSIAELGLVPVLVCLIKPVFMFCVLWRYHVMHIPFWYFFQALGQKWKSRIQMWGSPRYFLPCAHLPARVLLSISTRLSEQNCWFSLLTTCSSSPWGACNATEMSEVDELSILQMMYPLVPVDQPWTQNERQGINYRICSFAHQNLSWWTLPEEFTF